MGPTQKKSNKEIFISKEANVRERQPECFFLKKNYILFSLASLFDIRKSDSQNSSGQERKGSTRRGLRVGTKNAGFRRIFN